MAAGPNPERVVAGRKLSAKRVSKVSTKVNPLWPNPRLVIALHSPNALLETGLRMCPPEKDLDIDPLDPKQSVL